VILVCVALPACGGTTSRQDVSWPAAKRLLRTCKVHSVDQTHRRIVTLKLRDGRLVVAHEPRIDDVFRVLRGLSPSCAPRTVGTE
jgi:hypothetical protein